jgi:hypothetical protein
LQLGRQRRGVDDAGHGEPAAVPQDAEGLAEHLLLVGDEVNHAIPDDDIGRLVGDRQVFEFAEAEFDIGGTDAGGVVRAFFSISWVMSTPMT